MKAIFTIILCVPLLAFSQSKKPKGKGYLKLSPSMFFPSNAEASFGVLSGFGAKLGDMVGFGVGVGVYKFKGFHNPIVPVGVDFTFLNFKKKASPMFVAGAYLPLINSPTSVNSRNLYVSSQIKGKSQFHVGGGLAVGSPKTHLGFTVSWSQLRYESSTSTTIVTGSRTSTSVYKGINSQNMIIASLSIVL